MRGKLNPIGESLITDCVTTYWLKLLKQSFYFIPAYLSVTGYL